MSMYYRGKDYDNVDTMRPLDRKVLTVLWSFARPFRPLLFTALAVMLLGTAADLVRPYLLKVAIDDQIAARNIDGLLRTAWLYGATILLSGVFDYIQTLLLQYIGQKIIFDVRQKVFRYLLYQRYAELENQPVGRMVTRVTNDTDAIEDLYTDVIVAFASDFLVLVGIIVVMLLIDWRMALASFTVIPLMAVLAVNYQRHARKAYRMVREKTAAINSFLQESMNGISVIKAFARFRRSGDDYRAVNREYLAAGLQEMRLFALYRPLVDLVYTLAVVVVVLWFGGWQSRYGGVEIGVIVAFLRYVEKFFWPIKDLAEKYSLLQSALAAAERVYDMIEGQPAEEPPGTSADRDFRGDICFEDVWFAYEEPHWVLRGVTLQARAGELVGIAGLSGSGKTTLVSLLLRFYEPQQGRILLDGTDIRDIPLNILRRKVGVVFQEVHMFNGTVADNISLFDPSISREEIMAAARTANIDAFIDSLPQGYDTPIGYQGALVSVGQRQLLSLARALACRSDVLVLDEATSSIDGETELLIQNALVKIAAERTMLVVAHRLSTIAAADRIIVLHQGRLTEQGTHGELLDARGLYWRLYNSQ
ncbi:MAG: ABC transporter ATP-binding protein [Negativicutes bacterium]|nr:ABC transporter ATP-binding protein [Negativicutes bacterium]